MLAWWCQGKKASFKERGASLLFNDVFLVVMTCTLLSSDIELFRYITYTDKQLSHTTFLSLVIVRYITSLDAGYLIRHLIMSQGANSIQLGALLSRLHT